jgi:hypothetical protein
MKLIGFAIYVGIGAMLHAIAIGPHFDWSSAWTIGWLLGWPIMLFIWFWAGMLGLVVVGTIIACLWMWLDSYANWRARRRLAKMRKAKA